MKPKTQLGVAWRDISSQRISSVAIDGDMSHDTKPHHVIQIGLEYGVRAPFFYGNLQEKTVFHEYLQEAYVVFTDISESLRKPPGVYGIM